MGLQRDPLRGRSDIAATDWRFLREPGLRCRLLLFRRGRGVVCCEFSYKNLRREGGFLIGSRLMRVRPHRFYGDVSWRSVAEKEMERPRQIRLSFYRSIVLGLLLCGRRPLRSERRCRIHVSILLFGVVGRPLGVCIEQFDT